MDKKLTLGEIEINDGEFANDEAAKELEKSQKEAEKELEKSEKIVLDINDAEADKPKFTDGSGKKLHLAEDVNEDIRDVKGLGNAYKKARFFARNADTDFHNADYKEISPAEAMARFKAGEGDGIRLLVGGRLVTLKDRGYGASDPNTRVKWVGGDKGYTKKSGEEVYDTAYMPLSHLVNIADKIIITNEKNVKRDPAQRAERSKNPASKYFNGFDGSNDTSLRSYGNVAKIDKDATDIAHDRGIIGNDKIVIRQPNYDERDTAEIRGNNSDFYSTIHTGKKGYSSYGDSIKRYTTRLKLLKDRYNAGEITKAEYDADREDLLSTIRYYQRKASQSADDNARARYADSEYAMSKKFNTAYAKKLKLANLMGDIDGAQNNYDKVVKVGASSTQENREKLNRYEAELKDLTKKIALMKFKLEDTKEEDEAAAKEYKDVLDAKKKELNTMIADIDTLLKGGK